MALYGEYFIRMSRAQMPEAAAVADTMVAVTRPLADPQPYYHALRNRCYTAFLSGRFARMADDIADLGGLDWGLSGAPHSDFSGNLPRALLELYRGMYLWCAGCSDQARVAIDLGLNAIRESGRVNIIAFGLHTLSTLRLMQLDFDAVHATSRELIGIGEEFGLPTYLTSGRALDGIRLIRAGQASDGSRVLSEALCSLNRLNNHYLRPHLLCWLAVGRAASDGARAAVETLEEAAERIGRSGEELFRPVLDLTRGRLFEKFGDTAAAAASFRAAVDVAHLQGSRALELRAATELTELQSRAGDPEAAVTLLRALVSSFPKNTGSAELLRAVDVLRRSTAAPNDWRRAPTGRRRPRLEPGRARTDDPTAG
jgi:hypothetical protein